MGRVLDVFDRRTSLFVFSSTLLTGATNAFGQAALKYMGDDLSDALTLQRDAVNAPRREHFDQFAVKFVITGFNVRKKSAVDAAASGAFISSERAIADLKASIGSVVDNNPNYVLSENSVNAQILAINFVTSAGVALVPDVRDILPIGVAVADPTREKGLNNDVGVVLDIALQTMGIIDSKDLIDEALKDKDVQTFLDSALPLIQSENWQKLVELLEGLFKFIIAKKFFENYAEKVGKRVAFRLGLRCVPILGWVYVVAACLLALKANYHRFSFA
jgi:hypothetical protein